MRSIKIAFIKKRFRPRAYTCVRVDELIRLFHQRSGPADSDQGPQTLNMDVTERQIGRSTDQAVQGNDYSGKQHGRRLKNMVVCAEYQFIHHNCYDNAYGQTTTFILANKYPEIPLL